MNNDVHNARNVGNVNKRESGQAIILVAVMMVGLMGMLGVAIDGGGLYFLHRDTQNAVDAALVAATYAQCTGRRPDASDVAAYNAYRQRIIDAGISAASLAGFDNASNGVIVTVNPDYTPPDASDKNYVEVLISARKPSFFIQLVYQPELRVTTRGVGFCQPTRQGLIPGNNAIISFRPAVTTCSMSSNHLALANSGNSVMTVHNSGVFSNANTSCSIDGRGTSDFIIEGPCTSAGTFNTANMNCQGGTSMNQPQISGNPLASLPRPECIPGENRTGNDYRPGTYNSITSTANFIEPGVYCINSISLQAHERLNGEVGVVIYMPPGNGGISMTGQSMGNMRAPTGPDTTPGCIPDVTCQWQGLLIWSDVNSPNGGVIENGEINIRGGAANEWRGMIYSPGSNCSMAGNQRSFFYGIYACYSVRGVGTEDLDVYYEYPEFLNTPPLVSIAE